MKQNLDSIKELLSNFTDELAVKVELEKDHEIINDYDDTLRSWEKAEAYGWIFLESQYLFFWSVSEETKMRSQKNRKYPEHLLRNGNEYYLTWQNKVIEMKDVKRTVPRLCESSRYARYGIPQSLPTESLIAYINRLRELVSDKTYPKKQWGESLGSFLEFVRLHTSSDCHGFIDIIFPEDRAFYYGTIIR